MRSQACLLATSLTLLACVDVEINDQLWRCERSEDCGAGWQCDSVAGHCIQALEGRDGVFSDKLVMGTNLPLTDQSLGLNLVAERLVRGVEAYFTHVNRTGGIHGRKLELVTRDAIFGDLTAARANLEDLLVPEGGGRKVFGTIFVLGTEESLLARELSVENRALLWAPGTGSDALELDPPDRYVYNFRARFSDEAEQLTRYVHFNLDPRTPTANVAVFGPEPGSFGVIDEDLLAVVESTESTLQAIDEAAPAKITVALAPADSLNVTAPTLTLLKWAAATERVVAADGERHLGVLLSAFATSSLLLLQELSAQVGRARLRYANRATTPDSAIDLSAAYASALTEAEKERLSRVNLRFMALSFIGTEIINGLKLLQPVATTDGDGAPTTRRVGQGMLIAQTVPPTDSNSSGVLRYREHMRALDAEAELDGFSLEAYLAAWLLGEALRRHGPDLTTESFVEGIPGLQFDLGIGAEAAFTPEEHQALRKIWGVQLTADLEPRSVGLLVP